MTENQRHLLKSSWSVISSEMGQTLFYINENGSADEREYIIKNNNGFFIKNYLFNTNVL